MCALSLMLDVCLICARAALYYLATMTGADASVKKKTRASAVKHKCQVWVQWKHVAKTLTKEEKARAGELRRKHTNTDGHVNFGGHTILEGVNESVKADESSCYLIFFEDLGFKRRLERSCFDTDKPEDLQVWSLTG
jgi:hypothetical protein